MVVGLGKVGAAVRLLAELGRAGDEGDAIVWEVVFLLVKSDEIGSNRVRGMKCKKVPGVMPQVQSVKYLTSSQMKENYNYHNPYRQEKR